ncbi:MAG: phospholipid carrier-dependent glycosyltransferase, partial [Actinomycetota bacterium]
MSAVLERLNRPVVAVLAVTAIAGIIRFAAIDDPAEMVFDELYYAKAGCIQVTGGSNRECRIDSDDEKFWREHEWDVGSWVHPPLGKLTIGLGISAFTMDAFGWRFTSVLAGIGVAVFTALMAQVLFGRPVWTFAAGLLIAVDGLNVVLSRTALLDIHLAFWVALGFLCLVLDRRWIDRRTPTDPTTDEEPELEVEPTTMVEVAAAPRIPSPFWRPWRFAAGAAFGA